LPRRRQFGEPSDYSSNEVLEEAVEDLDVPLAGRRLH
jgi:hypothetical protein